MAGLFITWWACRQFRHRLLAIARSCPAVCTFPISLVLPWALFRGVIGGVQVAPTALAVSPCLTAAVTVLLAVEADQLAWAAGVIAPAFATPVIPVAPAPVVIAVAPATTITVPHGLGDCLRDLRLRICSHCRSALSHDPLEGLRHCEHLCLQAARADLDDRLDLALVCSHLLLELVKLIA